MDAKKLWTNYYTYKPVVDIQYHASNDMPTETATITVTNTFHNLDRNYGALQNYSISNDSDYNWLNRKLYKTFGMLIGGVKVNSRMVQLHSILFEHTKLREGARIHLRLGYGSDPLSLAPIINGSISSLSLGEQIEIVVTSDGHELIQNITSDKTKDVNNGALGLFGLGANQEASNIISSILVKRDSWVNHLMFGKTLYEKSKYNIEHFGLYLWSGIDTRIYEQYDLLSNIYKSSYKADLYMYSNIANLDGEANISFNKYNMTPWDVFELCTQTSPEYILKAQYYQFDSRLFYGLPFYLTKYRYDIINDNVYQECKSITQAHYLDSLFNIIQNNVSVTSRYSFTNAKVIYTLGHTPTSTSVIHSDDKIANSKQDTHIIDSAIVQNSLGIDAVNQFFGYRIGKKAARKLGISNLLYGWQQQYQGNLLILGAPQIRPDDYLMLNDMFTTLNGLCIAREVIHSFNTSSGFTTTIVPGMLSFSPEFETETSNINLTVNYLNLLSSFSQLAYDRAIIKDTYEQYQDIVSKVDSYNTKKNMLEFFGALSYTPEIIEAYDLGIGTFLLVRQLVHGVSTIAELGQRVKTTVSSLKTVLDTYKGIKGVMSVIDTIKFTKDLGNLASKVSVGMKAAEGASVASAGWTFGLSLLLFALIDALIDGLLEWISNKNTVVLLPLWWEGRPFVSGVKGGEKILLMDSQSTATEENTKEDGTINQNSDDVEDYYTDEQAYEKDKDYISVEDN